MPHQSKRLKSRAKRRSFCTFEILRFSGNEAQGLWLLAFDSRSVDGFVFGASYPALKNLIS
ncbi:hypothetical protein GCM10010987_35430 [Bradyrhizobium guangdongense]|uniref:Uncharacterized protein n=1 Tax=Bradyrhizobium guangdongense TaxID=1325090 RepID=A0AA88B8X5_9BRAD|nr:hypothetical protein GCM10010987_35430 [Bradyrhizobium guangdongense]